ncbi:hypothetical protein FF1_047195 [Malus domestica]
MEEKMVRKVPGCSSIEANVEVFEFVAGDWSHVFMDDIMLVSLPIDKHLKSHWFDRDDCHRRQFQKSEKPKFVNNLDVAPLKLSMLLSKPESLLLDSRTKREVVGVVVWMSLLALINDWSTMDLDGEGQRLQAWGFLGFRFRCAVDGWDMDNSYIVFQGRKCNSTII